MAAAPAVEDAEAAEPVVLDVSNEVPVPVVVDEVSDALEVMVVMLLPVAVADGLPVAVKVGTLVDEAVPEPAVAL